MLVAGVALVAAVRASVVPLWLFRWAPGAWLDSQRWRSPAELVGEVIEWIDRGLSKRVGDAHRSLELLHAPAD